MKNTKIAFIGGGNMASSIIGGLISDGHDPLCISVSDPHQEKLSWLQNQFQTKVYSDNIENVQQADVIVLAVKPQHLLDAIHSIQDAVDSKQMLVSIIAGVQSIDIARCFKEKMAIVRVMPNTPALLKTGASGLYANEHVTEQQKQIAESLMRSVGITAWVEDESLMDVITALSGSGPAYFFWTMNALEQAAVDLGLPADIARVFCLETALGAAKMAIESEDSVLELQQRVTSPGGTTEAALNVLEQVNAKQFWAQAVLAATKRGKELAEAFHQQLQDKT